MFLFLTCIIRSSKLYPWHSGKQFRFMSIMYWKSGYCVVFKPEPQISLLFTKQIKFNRQNYLNRNVLSGIKNSCLLELLTVSSTNSLIFTQVPLPKGKEGKLPNNMRKLALASISYKNVNDFKTKNWYETYRELPQRFVWFYGSKFPI